MGRLRLVLVEQDEAYLNCLSDYLSLEQAEKFQINAFTTESALDEFLAREPLVDLVLTSKLFYEKWQSCDQGVIICLGEEEQNDAAQGSRVIYKYQYGAQIVQELLQIYAAEMPARQSPGGLSYPGSGTRVIGVYSPMGGVGKTTLAVGASIQTALAGRNVFYLNLENSPSTALYFAGQQEKNLSHVLYYLKENLKNLPWQIESAKCIDPNYQVAYFRQPDSMFDFAGDLSTELLCLLRELRATKQYERVFIDFSAAINKNNLAMLQACDEVLFVAEGEKTAQFKIDVFWRELALLFSPQENQDLLAKCRLVFNRVRPGMSPEEESPIPEKKVCAYFPWVESLVSMRGDLLQIDLNSAFGQELHRLLTRF